MRTINRRSFLALLGKSILLAGCARLNLKDGPVHYGKEINLTVRPEQSLGVRVTPALEIGNVTVFDLPMSDSQIGSEMYPGRIMFPGIIANKKGENVFAQSILSGMYPDGRFMSFVIADSRLTDMRGAKFLPLSSQTNAFWNQHGNPVLFDRVKFYEEKEYRDKLIMENGVPIGDRKLVKGFDKMVRSWNQYSANGFDIYSTIGEDDIKQIAKINPGYGIVEKLVLRNKAVISLNPIEMIARASITVFAASTGRTQGWDYTSELPSREQMAMIVEFIGAFRLKLIADLNQEKYEHLGG
mgnify:CR=1 FL=1